MRQNNFRIFKEHRAARLHKTCREERREATHAPHAMHVSLHASSAKDFFGGASRDRTDDLLLAKQALSQLSYGP